MRFLVVGAVSTGVNFALFLLLLQLAVGYSMASGVGYLAGVATGFFLNRAWTYESDSLSPRTIGLYAVVYLFSLGENLITLPLLIEFWKMSPVVANVLVLILTTMTNFVGTKYLVFRK